MIGVCKKKIGHYISLIANYRLGLQMCRMTSPYVEIGNVNELNYVKKS